MSGWCYIWYASRDGERVWNGETWALGMEGTLGPGASLSRDGGDQCSAQGPPASVGSLAPHNTTFLSAGPDSRAHQKLWPHYGLKGDKRCVCVVGVEGWGWTDDMGVGKAVVKRIVLHVLMWLMFALTGDAGGVLGQSKQDPDTTLRQNVTFSLSINSLSHTSFCAHFSLSLSLSLHSILLLSTHLFSFSSSPLVFFILPTKYVERR